MRSLTFNAFVRGNEVRNTVESDKGGHLGDACVVREEELLGFSDSDKIKISSEITAGHP